MLGAILLFVSTMARASSATELAEAVAPAALIATRVCTTYAEQVFAPQLVEAVRAQAGSRRITPDELRRVVQKFDAATNTFCEAARHAAQERKAEISGIFAKYHAVALQPDWERFLADPASRAWAADDAAFSVRAFPLVAVFALLNELAPDTLGAELRGSGVLRFANVQDPDLRAAYERTSKGKGDLAYRRMITLMLNDPGFASMAPSRYRIKELAASDADLRKRGELATRRGPRFDALESAFVRTESAVQDLLAARLQEPGRAALKAMTDSGR